MRDLWKIIDALVENKYMVRFASWPGGARSLAVYKNEKQDKQWLYEADSLGGLELALKKDFGHFIAAPPILPILPSLPKMPGLPKL